MSDLAGGKCAPCEGGVPALTAAEAADLLRGLHPDWKLSVDSKSLKRSLKFGNFHRTMSFVNAIAHIANVEDHHPDLELGYGYCRISYSTHAIGALSRNDFICAAKIDRLSE